MQVRVLPPPQTKNKETMDKIKQLEQQMADMSSELQKLKKELSEPVFEVNKWYKDKTSYLIFYIQEVKDKSLYGYGFGSKESWFENHDFYHFNMDGAKKDLRPATESEVFEALKKEAIKRGFKEGVYFIARNDYPKNFKAKYNGEDLKWEYGDLCFLHKDSEYYLRVFRKGKWAEIIKDEPFKICGYSVEKRESNYKIGCKIITRNTAASLAGLMTEHNFKTVQFDEYKVTLEEINKLLEL